MRWRFWREPPRPATLGPQPVRPAKPTVTNTWADDVALATRLLHPHTPEGGRAMPGPEQVAYAHALLDLARVLQADAMLGTTEPPPPPPFLDMIALAEAARLGGAP